MKLKTIILTIFFLLIFILYYSISEARSGCCSHHGGVCGCGCCDGSNLSAKCSPYYPECSTSSDSYTTSNSINTYSTSESNPYTSTINLNSKDVSPTHSVSSYSNNDINIPEPEKTTYSNSITQTGLDSSNNSEVINETSLDQSKEDLSSTGFILLILIGFGFYFFRKKK